MSVFTVTSSIEVKFTLCSGTTAVSPNGELLLVGNLSTGVEVYNTQTFDCGKVIHLPNCINVMNQVSYTYHDEILATGSDSGLVSLFKTTGLHMQDLQHGGCESITRIWQLMLMLVLLIQRKHWFNASGFVFHSTCHSVLIHIDGRRPHLAHSDAFPVLLIAYVDHTCLRRYGVHVR
jgi:hypothetical protein